MTDKLWAADLVFAIVLDRNLLKEYIHVCSGPLDSYRTEICTM